MISEQNESTNENHEKSGVKREYQETESHDHNDHNESSQRQKKPRVGEGPQIECRILLPSRVAGGVIGKGGLTIKRLREEYSAHITLPDSRTPERILVMNATTGSVCDLMLEILPIIKEEKDRDTEIRLLIHQSQAGCIIGKGGTKIKDLRDQTGANLKVFGEPCPRSTERVCAIGSANFETISNALSVIFSLLNSCPIKGYHDPYDPTNSNEFSAQEYGGYTTSSNDRNNRGGRQGRDSNRRGDGRFGGGRDRRDSNRGGGGRGSDRGGHRGNQRDDSSRFGRGRDSGRSRGNDRRGSQREMYGNNNRNNRYDDGYQGGYSGEQDNFSSMGERNNSSGFGRGYDEPRGGYGKVQPLEDSYDYGRNQVPARMNSSFNRGGYGDEPVRGSNFNSSYSDVPSSQVSIPDDLAGAVIGKGGMRIRQIREESGAKISINEGVPGSDRIITINGLPEQIQNAQYLLQMSVKQYTASNRF